MHLCVTVCRRCVGGVDGDAAGRSDAARAYSQGGATVHLLDGAPRHHIRLPCHRAPAAAAARQVEETRRAVGAPPAPAAAVSPARPR